PPALRPPRRRRPACCFAPAKGCVNSWPLPGALTMAETSETLSCAGNLEEILAEYLRAVDAGKSPDPQSLIDANPEYRQQQKEFLPDDRRGDGMPPPPRGAGPPGAAPQPPALEDFEILEPITPAGGMGVVYKARQRSANRIVVIKIIRPDRLDN